MTNPLPQAPEKPKVAVIGTGLVGRAWGIVFARAGFQVRMWDVNPAAVSAALAFIEARLPELAEAGLLGGDTPKAVMMRLHAASTLKDALDGVVYVQESGPEDVTKKAEIFAEMDRLADPETVLASSTSAIKCSDFTANLKGRARCIVSHPVNPPYLIPVVELAPAPWTDPATIAWTRAFMTEAGMVPAVLKREVAGFLVNRLQAALLNEALHLVEAGYADPEDVDAAVKHGLGLRWAFIGPLETIDLNAPGGLRDYCARYGPSFRDMIRETPAQAWSQDIIERLHADQRERLAIEDHPARQAWRDRRLMALAAHKAKQEN
jgi:3-hydroxyacyl-CoA dehydrogenase